MCSKLCTCLRFIKLLACQSTYMMFKLSTYPTTYCSSFILIYTISILLWVYCISFYCSTTMRVCYMYTIFYRIFFCFLAYTTIYELTIHCFTLALYCAALGLQQFQLGFCIGSCRDRSNFQQSASVSSSPKFRIFRIAVALLYKLI